MHNVSALSILVASFAAYRLTRLVVADKILERPVGWLETRLPDSVAYMLSCWWCAGMWVSLVVGTVTVFWSDNRVVAAVGVGLALSTFVGLAAGLTESDDEPEHGIVFDPSAAPMIVGMDRDALLDLRASVLGWVGDIELWRARAQQGVFSPGEAIAWETVELIESTLARSAPDIDTSD